MPVVQFGSLVRRPRVRVVNDDACCLFSTGTVGGLRTRLAEGLRSDRSSEAPVAFQADSVRPPEQAEDEVGLR